MNVIEPNQEKPMKTYEIKGVPDTPLVRVYVDGVYEREFTSLYAAKCWIEHMQKLERVRR